MFPVADDFAAIARRLKEIQAEVAQERRKTEPPDRVEPGQSQPMCDAYGDLAGCA